MSLFVATAAPGVGWGQTPATRPEVGPATPFRPVPRSERTLANGLRVVVARYPTVPKASVTLVIGSGLAADPQGLPGVAALTAAAIQEGTRTRTSQQVREDAFGMGGSLSAFASQDYTAVSIRGLSRFTDGLIDLLADVVRHPTFPAGEVELLRTNRLVELQQQSTSPQFVANREFRRSLFGSHPYARISTTPEALEAIDRARLVAFHGAHYRPNNAVLLVVGDVEAESVMAAAGRAFGDWPRGEVPAAEFPPLPDLDGRQLTFVQRPGSIQSSIALGNFAPPRGDPEWYSMVVANTIYGGAFNSRIVRNLREEKGYTYSPFSQYAAFADAGLYLFAADVRNEVTGAALAEVYAEIEKLRQDGAAGAELEGTKQYLRGVFVIQNATQEGVRNRLTDVYVYDLPKDYLETYQSKISAVGPDQVKAAARELFGLDRSVVVIVGDYPAVKDQLSSFGPTRFADVHGEPLETPPDQDAPR